MANIGRHWQTNQRNQRKHEVYKDAMISTVFMFSISHKLVHAATEKISL